MKVKVKRLFSLGKLVFKHDEPQVERPPYIGELMVVEVRDHVLGRPVLRARLMDSEGVDTDLLPELTDVRLLALDGDHMRLTGLESINGAAHAQTWAVQVVPC